MTGWLLYQTSFFEVWKELIWLLLLPKTQQDQLILTVVKIYRNLTKQAKVSLVLMLKENWVNLQQGRWNLTLFFSCCLCRESGPQALVLPC